MAEPTLTCLNCGQTSPAGTRYCPNCGEPVDPALVTELTDMYHTLLALDQHIADGQGLMTLIDLRDELRNTYESLRKQPATTPVSAQATPDTSAATPAATLTPVASAGAGAAPTPTGFPPPATVPAGPAFSWSAFIADQAIAIMAYLGAFLLLMATLSFEIAGLPGLGDSAKLAVVIVVYLLFGVLGARLRQAARLRTVGGAYLGVFALMTPLVALAVYLFALRGLGLSVAGMLTIGAGYATCIYVILAWRTRFATYGYLAWVALAVAALATISWANAPAEWWVAALGSAALVMLGARLLAPTQNAIGEPALIVAALTSGLALLGEIYLTLITWAGSFNSSLSPAATTLGSVVLVAVALAWGRYLRMRAWRNVRDRQSGVDLLDWLAAALAAQTVIAAAHWVQADRGTVASIVAALGLAEGAGAIATRRLGRNGNGLRLGLEGLAVALPTLGALTITFDPAPNWALAWTLSAGMLASLAIMWLERLPGWLLVAGIFASLAYHSAVIGVLTANAPAQADPHQGALLVTSSEFGFALALVGVALALGFGAARRTERFMLHAVALGNALYVTVIMLFTLPQDHAFQLLVLAAFMGAAYLAATQQRVAGMTAAATFFGLVATAVLPEPNYVTTLILTGAAAVAGAVVSRIFAPRWAAALYALGVGASLFAVNRTMPHDGMHIALLLLIFAAAAYVLAALERTPLAGIAPVLYATGAVLAHPDPHFLLPLALILSALGLIIGRVAGPRWLWPPYAAAAVAAAGTALQSTGDLRFETLALAAFFVAAYVIAAVEARLEVLVAAFIIGAGALATGLGWQQVEPWQTRLAFVALAYAFAALGYLWRILPWMGTPRPAWWANTNGTTVDARTAGMQIHRWAGIVLAAGTAAVACLGAGGFVPQLPETQAAVGVLLLSGAMLVWRSFDREAILPNPRLLWYVAGECLALAITWEARWLGADNMQAFVLAPGSYQLIAGALLPVDGGLGRPVQLGRVASLVGALLLLAPTLLQSFQADPNWLYALALAAEAIIIVGVGVGTRTRLLVLIGSSFVGLAALRGAILAFQSGAVAVVIGLLAALLMGGATWLSLRSRAQTASGNQP